jgi:hypothetical protein
MTDSPLLPPGLADELGCVGLAHLRDVLRVGRLHRGEGIANLGMLGGVRGNVDPLVPKCSGMSAQVRRNRCPSAGGTRAQVAPERLPESRRNTHVNHI